MPLKPTFSLALMLFLLFVFAIHTGALVAKTENCLKVFRTKRNLPKFFGGDEF